MVGKIPPCITRRSKKKIQSLSLSFLSTMASRSSSSGCYDACAANKAVIELNANPYRLI